MTPDDSHIFYNNWRTQPKMATHGEGIYLYDKKDKPYVDLISGIAVNNIGHKNKQVTKAIKKQVDKYSHQMVYGEYIVGPQVKLAKKACSIKKASRIGR